MHKRSYVSDGFVGKAAKDGGNVSYDFVLSSETEDRMGDIIDSTTWQLGNFKKNPIALFSHDNKWPIGKWSNVHVAGKKLLGTLTLASKGTNSLIDTMHSLLEQGIMRAVSVGFIPGTAERIENTYGYIFRDCDLMEVSLVSVPANPEALARTKGLHLSAATKDLIFADPGSVHKTGYIETVTDKLPGDSADTTTTPVIKTPKIDLIRQRFDLQ